MDTETEQLLNTIGIFLVPAIFLLLGLIDKIIRIIKGEKRIKRKTRII